MNHASRLAVNPGLDQPAGDRAYGRVSTVMASTPPPRRLTGRLTGRLSRWLAPARTVPTTPWRSPRRWTGKPATLAMLFTGLWIFGTGEAALIAAGLGVSPWTVFAQGLSIRLGLSIGVTTFIIGAAVLLLWIPLRERPGLGTVSNIVLVSTSLQVMSSVLPHPRGFGWQLAMVLAGIGLLGIGSGIYLTCNLGPGPRDGWMTGLHQRLGWPLTTVRLGIEVVVLAVGWLLGGTVGLGTVLFALLVGWSVGTGLRIVGSLGAVRGAPETEEDVFPGLEA